MSKTKRVSILMIHYKDSPDTVGCLDSLAAVKTNHRIQVYILSVQSKESSEITNHAIKPVITYSTENLGFTGGNNVLIKQSMADGADIIILLNNDTYVDPGFIDPLIDQLSHKEVGIVCSKIYFGKGCEYHKKAYKTSELGHVVWYMGGVIDWAHVNASHWGVDEVDHGQFTQSLETQFGTGCCFAMRRDVVEEVGMLDDNFFLYFEDADLSMRVRRKKYKVIVEPASIIWHLNAGSSNGPGSSIHQYYQTRNRFLFGMRYAPLRVKYHLIKQYVGFLRNDNQAIREAAHDAFLFRYGKKRG